jgi:hypothetical protein
MQYKIHVMFKIPFLTYDRTLETIVTGQGHRYGASLIP